MGHLSRRQMWVIAPPSHSRIPAGRQNDSFLSNADPMDFGIWIWQWLDHSAGDPPTSTASNSIPKTNIVTTEIV